MEFVNIHSHFTKRSPNEWVLQNIAIQDGVPTDVPISTGWHPWDLLKISEEDAKLKMEQIFPMPNVLAIGECGLDKFIPVEISKQLEVLAWHIEWSEALQKPLILHLVGYYEELISLKKKSQPKQPWLVHGFQKKDALAKQLTNAGCVLSFGKPLMQKDSLKNVLLQQKNQLFFFETDMQTDVSIPQLYEEGARILGVSLEKLVEIIQENKKQFFNL